MKTADASSFSQRVVRFLRWFFTASPEALAPPQQPPQAKLRSRTVAERKPTPLRPRHAGPVRVAAKAEQ